MTEQGTDAVRLVPLKLDDPAFRRHLLAYWAELGAKPDAAWTNHYLSRINALEGNGRWSFWGVSDQGQVGFALLRTEADWLFPERRGGYIAEFTVFPGHRRQGIGRALYRRVEEYLRGQGCLNIELDVLPTNGVGMLFWRKQGFDLAHHRMRQFM